MTAYLYGKHKPRLSIGINKMSGDILLIILTLLAAVFLPFLKPVIYVLLIMYCLSGPEGIIKALTLSWILLMTTPAFGVASHISLLKSCVPACALVSLFLYWTMKSKLYPPRSTIWILAFGMLVLLFSAISSYAFDVSLLKIMMFSIALISIFWAMKYAVKSADMHNWFTTVFISILFLSVCFLPIAEGYLRNGTGFQGVFNHPQVMGTFAGITIAWFFARVVMYRDTKPVYILAFVLALSMLFLSEARVGLATAFIGITFAFFSRSATKTKVSALIFMSMSMCVLIFASLFFNIGGSAEDFLKKRSQKASAVESLVSTRMPLIVTSWMNFSDNPYTGRGFGLPSNPADLDVKYDPIFGIPVSASAEKGVFFVAILEEIGVLGTLAFLALLGFFFVKVYYAGHAELMALFIAPIASNLGDATLFSVGGNGLFIWLMIAYAFCASSQLVENRKRKPVFKEGSSSL